MQEIIFIGFDGLIPALEFDQAIYSVTHVNREHFDRLYADVDPNTVLVVVDLNVLGKLLVLANDRERKARADALKSGQNEDQGRKKHENECAAEKLTSAVISIMLPNKRLCPITCLIGNEFTDEPFESAFRHRLSLYEIGPSAAKTEANEIKAVVQYRLCREIVTQIYPRSRPLDLEIKPGILTFATPAVALCYKSCLCLLPRKSSGHVLQPETILTPFLRQFAVSIRSEDDAKEKLAAKWSLSPDHPSEEFPIDGTSVAVTRLCQKLLKATIFSRKAEHVLLIGETGTGKEGAAAVLHRCSNRRTAKFSTFNCATFEPQLAASQIFGSSDTAYTGACDRPAIFHECNGGTVFLDEVHTLKNDIKSKLLRFLQDSTYRRLGEEDQHAKHANVRVVCATNDPDFRNDPFVRKSGFIQRFKHVIELPALNDRREDIPDLIRIFARACLKQLAIRGVKNPDAMLERWQSENLLLFHTWQTMDWSNANIRSLKFAVERWIDTHVQDAVEAKELQRTEDDQPGLMQRSRRGRPQMLSSQEILAAFRKVRDEIGNLDQLLSELRTPMDKSPVYHNRRCFVARVTRMWNDAKKHKRQAEEDAILDMVTYFELGVRWAKPQEKKQDVHETASFTGLPPR